MPGITPPQRKKRTHGPLAHAQRPPQKSTKRENASRQFATKEHGLAVEHYLVFFCLLNSHAILRVYICDIIKSTKESMAKAKKHAVSGEYVITVEPDGSIRVCRICYDTLDTLRKIADAGGITFDQGWDIGQLGGKIVADLGDGETAETQEYTVTSHGADIKTWRVCDNAKEALRQVAVEAGFDFDNGWNTREFGNKLIDFINSPQTDEDVDDRAARVLRGMADKLGAEARKMGIPTTGSGLARKIASEARGVGIPTTKGGMARMAWSLLKNWLGIQIGPTGYAIAAAAILLAVVVAYLAWGGAAIVIAVLAAGLIYAAYRKFF